MVGIQRALILRKLESQRQRIDDLSPSKFKVTSFKFGAEDDSMLSTSSLLDKSAVMLSDEPFDSINYDIDESHGKVFRDRNRVEVNTAPSSPSRVMLSPAGIPVYDSNPFDDNPVEVTTVSSTTPKSFLHGMVIIDDEEVQTDNKHGHVQVTPTPKKRTVYHGKLFESSPLSPPTDEDEKMQGLSLLDESLNYSNNGTPQPSPTRRFMVKNDPSIFESSPITNAHELDYSLHQISMSSFIKNDTSYESMLTADRELLFDSSIKKKKEVKEETTVKTLYDDTKLDMKESIHLTAAFSERAKPLLTFDEGEGGNEYDYANENSSQLGIDTSLKQKKQQPSKKDILKASLSPTGVTDFFQEDVISSVPEPPLPPAAPDLSSSSLKTNFMTHLLDQALNGCQPCNNTVHTKTKKHQQPDSPVVERSRIPAPPSMKRPNLANLVYSPAQSPALELSMARKNANSTQRSLRRRDMKHVPKFLQTVERRGRL